MPRGGEALRLLVPGQDASGDAAAFDLVDAAPTKALAAAVAVGLVFPFHGDVAAGANKIGTFPEEGALIEDVLLHRHGPAIGRYLV